MDSFMHRVESSKNHLDEATRQIRLEVPYFCGKLDPYAFQDWVTALEDYFDWLGMIDHKVHFVRMKLKAEASKGLVTKSQRTVTLAPYINHLLVTGKR